MAKNDPQTWAKDCVFLFACKLMNTIQYPSQNFKTVSRACLTEPIGGDG